MPVPTSNQGAESKRWLVPLLASMNEGPLSSPVLRRDRPTVPLCLGCTSRRSACSRAVPRRLASALSCRSRGGAATGDDALVAAEMDDKGRCAPDFSFVICKGLRLRCGSAGALPHQYPQSELEPGACVHHRCFPAVDRADDLLRGDPFQVRAGGRQVGVPELALDQRQRDALMQQLDDRNAGAHRLTVASAEAAPGWGPGQMAVVGSVFVGWWLVGSGILRWISTRQPVTQTFSITRRTSLRRPAKSRPSSEAATRSLNPASRRRIRFWAASSALRR